MESSRIVNREYHMNSEQDKKKIREDGEVDE